MLGLASRLVLALELSLGFSVRALPGHGKRCVLSGFGLGLGLGLAPVLVLTVSVSVRLKVRIRV